MDSGLPLLRGLRILTKQSAVPGLKSVLQGMSEAVEGGATFSDALAQFPKVFDNLYVNMTRAGEAAGSLEISLNRLAEFLEKAAKIKSKVKSAMTYPVVVLVVALSLTGVLMVKVIPKFEKLFKDMLGNDAKMPAVTQFVINVSNNFINYAVPIAIGVVLLVFACRMVNKTKWGNMFFDRIKLKLPGFGELIRKSSIGRTTRTLGTLMQSGVPVLQALDIVRDTSGNAVIAKAYQQIHDAVKEGDNMTPSMEAVPADGGLDGGRRRGDRRAAGHAQPHRQHLRQRGGRRRERDDLDHRADDDRVPRRHRRHHRHRDVLAAHPDHQRHVGRLAPQC